MKCHEYTFTIVIALVAGLHLSSETSAEDVPIVRFDLPSVAAAKTDSSDATLVTAQLRLSSMIESAEVPRIDQWMVRCQPRDTAVSIADYAPRTETASDMASPIQVKETEEESKAFGLSLDGAYGHAVRGNLGTDHAKKNINSRQFDRVAPEQVVTASGTINRGRGVYFKLRWTAQQVLEGEKTFVLTLKVPPNWRGSLVDVSVVAQSERKSFGGWDRETETIASANFVVAIHREGDLEAAAHARALSDVEFALRNATAEHGVSTDINSLPSVLRHVAMKLDRGPNQPKQGWLQRLLLARADPHLDKEIRKLPMPIRVAVLDYAEVRDRFATMNDNNSNAYERVLAAKPAVE